MALAVGDAVGFCLNLALRTRIHVVMSTPTRRSESLLAESFQVDLIRTHHSRTVTHPIIQNPKLT